MSVGLVFYFLITAGSDVFVNFQKSQNRVYDKPERSKCVFHERMVKY
jgi:hypothetical protein